MYDVRIRSHGRIRIRQLFVKKRRVYYDNSVHWTLCLDCSRFDETGNEDHDKSVNTTQYLNDTPHDYRHSIYRSKTPIIDQSNSMNTKVSSNVLPETFNRDYRPIAVFIIVYRRLLHNGWCPMRMMTVIDQRQVMRMWWVQDDTAWMVNTVCN